MLRLPVEDYLVSFPVSPLPATVRGNPRHRAGVEGSGTPMGIPVGNSCGRYRSPMTVVTTNALRWLKVLPAPSAGGQNLTAPQAIATQYVPQRMSTSAPLCVAHTRRSRPPQW